MGVNDTSILLAAITGLALGSILQVDGEEMKAINPITTSATVPQPVLRGQNGTAQVAHPVSAQVKILQPPSNLSPGDFSFIGAPGSLGLATPVVPVWDRKSYSAAGAITLPTLGNNMLAEINGTGALAMTVANPSIGQDGSVLRISGNGKAAHTVTYTAGLGNVGATADVITFKADQAMTVDLVASGGFWQVSSVVAGAATIAGAGLA